LIEIKPSVGFSSPTIILNKDVLPGKENEKIYEGT
jgi:hypothetical protein